MLRLRPRSPPQGCKRRYMQTTLPLLTFQYERQTPIRTQMIDGEPWFYALDVCKALAIGNPSQAITRLDADDLSNTEGVDSLGRKARMTIVNESGLYDLVFQSRTVDDAGKAFSTKGHGTPTTVHQKIPLLSQTQPDRVSVKGDRNVVHNAGDMQGAPHQPRDHRQATRLPRAQTGERQGPCRSFNDDSRRSARQYPRNLSRVVPYAQEND
jgi:hypothetical protein